MSHEVIDRKPYLRLHNPICVGHECDIDIDISIIMAHSLTKKDSLDRNYIDHGGNIKFLLSPLTDSSEM